MSMLQGCIVRFGPQAAAPPLRIERLLIDPERPRSIMFVDALPRTAMAK
jgi:hypothetical protein